MPANTNFSLSSIDPDTLKQSLIDFLSAQPIFKDYNFAGSNINVLLDLLSRNSFLNSYLVNMSFAESQIDSAQLRDSIVSIAKRLNYLPSSVISSIAVVNLSLSTTSGNSFLIPFGSTFNGINSNGTFTYVTDRDYIQTSSNNTFNFNNISLYEGSYRTEVYVVDNSKQNQMFVTSNPTIDISSLIINVSENFGSSNSAFIKADSIYYLDGNTKVYFLQATENNLYEFYFGDGVLGYKPQNGSVITATYRVASGPAADGCNTFSLNYNLGAYNVTTLGNVVISTVGSSFGGSDIEDIESIRFNAPKAYQTQDKAVTTSDYKNLIKKNFPQVGDVNVYGGSITPDSVNFGSVFIATTSPSGNPLTTTNKLAIKSFLSNVSIIPLKDSINMINSNTLWINVNTNIQVDFSQTNNSINYYETLATNTVMTFSNTNLQKFNKNFRLSRLSDAFDSMDSNTIILGNETDYSIKKYFDISLGVNTYIFLTFNNPVVNISSTYFISNGLVSFVTDNYSGVNIPKGTLSLVTLQGNSVVNTTSIGTLNYDTGTVSIPTLRIDNFLQNVSAFYFTASPLTKTINVNNNDIIKIDVISGLNINISSVSGD